MDTKGRQSQAPRGVAVGPQLEREQRARLCERELRFFELEHELRGASEILMVNQSAALTHHALMQHPAEGLAPRQQHIDMESRNKTLSTDGEAASASPSDRKAAPLRDLVAAIVTEENMERSFRRVMSNLHNADSRSGGKRKRTTLIDGRACTPRMERYMRKKAEIIATLRQEIRDGSFRVSRLKAFETTDGTKTRTVQAPSVVERIGCNAIMEVLEERLSPLFIANTAASIKGRGPHGLFHEMQKAMAEHPELRYYYQSDYKGYYDHIRHDLLIDTIRQHVGDTTLLPILENFVKALHPEGGVGISKGLRSSQFFGNLYHNAVDHQMMEAHGARWYYRFCDDIFILGESKKELWRLRDALHEESARLGLIIKPSEKVAPVRSGMNALGYVNYGTHVLLRKRTKQNAARKLAKVRSRKRRQQIIGSFNGMACHADCKHLYFILTGKKMRKFSEIGVCYTPSDGKKRFAGNVMRLSDIVNIPVEIHDFETGIDTKEGKDRYLVSFRNPADQTWGKFFTASAEMKDILDKIGALPDALPFETVIKCETFGGGKRKYNFT